MTKSEISFQRIEEHLTKAKEKHPQFCDSMTIHTYKWHEHKAQVYREVIRRNPRAMNILIGEMHEIFEAYKSGDLEQAVDECYDAIAVLLRMIETMENEK